MSVSTAVVAALMGDTPYTDLVSTRLYPSVLPPKVTLPAATYNKVAGTGGTTTGPDLVMTRFQFDSFADTYLEAEDIGVKAYEALRRYSGTSDGLVIADVQMDYNQTVYDDVANLYRDIMDFKIWTNGL